MPRILKNIDQIALEKQRDVLYVLFHSSYNDIFNNEDLTRLCCTNRRKVELF